MKRWSLATKLALAVVPIALIALVAGGYAIWTLVEVADGTQQPVGGVAINRETAILVGAVAAGVFLTAVVVAYAIGRSVVRRVRSVTEAATKVAEVDLPNLVEALRNPHQELDELPPVDLERVGHDEIGELAESFHALHSTLVDVAGQQMDILRRGVSEIFVTLARRNRSLVDRQLSLIDELESREEDPEILGGYYKLDHLATRMRRNAESLLVLAGSEPPRVWAKPLDFSEVIRGALGEVDDYQRIDVLAMEPSRLSGSAVADVAHLVSELLDNATQYSPPTERVRVAGMFDPDGYLLTISDNGLGMPDARIAELNRVLEQPPALGLALEPTLGIYVVARLAARHGIKVVLIPGVPGVTARVTIPRGLLEVSRRTGSQDEIGSDGTDVADPKDELESVPPDEVAVSDGGGQYVFRRQDAKTHEEPSTDAPSVEKPTIDVPGRTVEAPSQPEQSPVEEPADEKAVEKRPDSGLVPDTTAEPPEPTPVQSDPTPASSAPTSPQPERTSSDEMKALTERLNRRNRITERPIEPDEPEPSPGPGESPEPSTPIEDASRGESRPDRAPQSLPVRTPGASYRGDEDGSASSATADGAMGIRSALTAYDEGRSAASTYVPEDEEPGDDRPGDEPR